MTDYIETKNPYKLSTDYHRLFALLVAGYEVAGWADSRIFAPDVTREICSAVRYKKKAVWIGVPGITYMSICPFQIDEKWCNKEGLSEEEIFCRFAGGINFAFIDPKEVVS